MIESPVCIFCKRETESLEHLFFNCYVTKFFWEAFCSWLIECSISLQPLTVTDIVLIFWDLQCGKGFRYFKSSCIGGQIVYL